MARAPGAAPGRSRARAEHGRPTRATFAHPGSIAVLLDTLLVRLLLLPAALRALGPLAWWTPRLLDRLPRALRLRHA